MAVAGDITTTIQDWILFIWVIYRLEKGKAAATPLKILSSACFSQQLTLSSQLISGQII